MHDAHFHFSKEIFDCLKKHQIQGICNIENIDEYKQVQTYCKDYFLHTSCGIHPWHVDTVEFDTFFPYLEQTKIIGEIGMDSIWCETDLQLQREVFEKQLQYASQTNKPVLLHTKGMEKEIVDLISKYENTYIVHWYSCMEHLEDYLKLNCYFTVGPSVGIDESVNQVVEQVNLDHLLMESDGIDALKWAFDTDEVNYISCLERSIQEISKIKKLDSKIVEQTLDENFNKIVKRIL